MSRVEVLNLPALLAGGLPPICAVIGEEVALVDDCLSLVRQAAERQGFPQRQFIFADSSADWPELCGSLSSGSLFGERNFVQIMLSPVAPVGERNRANEGIEKLLKAVSDEDLVLISAPPSRGKVGWIGAVEQRGVLVEIKRPNLQFQRRWVKNLLRRSGIELSLERETTLLERTEGNLLAARAEVAVLAMSPAEHRESAAAAAESADAGRMDVFQLAAACLEGNTARAVRAIRLIQGVSGDQAPLALAILGRHLATACRLQQHRAAGLNLGQAMEKERVWSRDRRGFESLLRRLPPATLKALAGHMGELDRRIKGYGIGDPWQEIGRLALGLCGLFPFRRQR